MDYLSVAEAAEKWGVSPRRVQVYCRTERIEGADRFGRSWRIPSDAPKPADPRVGRGGESREASSSIHASEKAPSCSEQPRYVPGILIVDLRSLPIVDLDAAIETLPMQERAQCRAELDYLRGNLQQVEDYCRTVAITHPTFLCACSLKLVTAVERGDYGAFSETVEILKTIERDAPHPQDRLMAEAVHVLAEVSMFDKESLPAWLRENDLSIFPREAFPTALYLRVKYLEASKRYESMLATAQATLLLCSRPNTFSSVMLHLHLSCASAYVLLGDKEACSAQLAESLAIALPNGFITPFADTLLSCGGLLEPLVQAKWPQYYDSIVNNPTLSWKNWIAFHNQFAKDNITLVLSDQEYILAFHLTSGMTYAEAAKAMHLSVGRVKNLVSGIYSKLNITNRKQLEPFIL